MNKYLIGSLIVLTGIGIFVLIQFMGYSHKESLTENQAQIRSENYLALASKDFESFSQHLILPMFDPAQMKQRLEEGALTEPQRIEVSRLENRVKVGGLDEKSISDISGIFHCGGRDEKKRFNMRLVYDDQTEDWKVMDFAFDNCS